MNVAGVSWAATGATSIVIVTQGLAGPPGPRGAPLMLSREELRVSALEGRCCLGARGFHPALVGATLEERG